MINKKYFLPGLSILFYFFLLLGDLNSQNMEAIYWFKKGVSEKDPEKKIEYYRKAVTAKPNFIEAYYNLGLAYMIQKKYNQAEEAFKKAVTVDSGSRENKLKSNVLNRLGKVYRKLERYPEAEEALQGALNLTNDNKFKALTLYELGQIKIAQGEYEKAISYFRQGLEISPGDRISFETGIQLARDQKEITELYHQGMELLQNQKLSEATDAFNNIIDINPNHLGARIQLEKITTLLEQKQLTNIEEIKPVYDQAMVFMNNGDWAKAIQYLEKIKQIQPNYPGVDKLLGQAQELHYQQLLTLQKIENFYNRGTENFDSGNYAVALVNFEKVEELDPNYRDIASRIQITKNEINRINKLTSRVTRTVENPFIETGDDYQYDLNKPDNVSTASQLFTDRSRQMNAAIDSQLVKSYYQEALDLMQRQDWSRAVILLEKVKLIRPGYKNTEFLLNQSKQNIELANFANTDEMSSTSTSRSSAIFISVFLGSVIIVPLGLFFASPTTRAKYYILLKRYDKAREIYERMLSKKPNNIKLYITLANIYINQNRVDEVAIRIFERAIQYNDNLKIQLEPIVTRYYLQKSKSSDTPKNLLTGKLKEELERMGI